MQIDKYKLFSRTFFTLFWVMMCWGFVSQELLPPLERFDTVELLVVDLAFVLLGSVTLRNAGDILVAVVFFTLGLISNLLINKIGMVNLFNGSRDFISIIFAVPIIRWFMSSRHASQFIADMDRQLRIWLYIQAFCLVWQFLRYGACDAGGGSFGYGSSGMVSTLIYLISFYLLSKKWDSSNFYRSLKENKQYLLLLIPTFLNETKISFVYLMIYILLLFKYDRALLLRSVFIFPLFFGFMAMMFSIYVSSTGADEEDLLTWDFIEHYLVTGGEDLDYEVEMALMYQDGDFDDDLSVEWWTLDMPRYAKVILIIPIMCEYKDGLWAGAGVGTLKSGRFMDQTRFAKEYDWVLKGTRIWLLFLFVSLGIPGIIWWLWAFCRVAFSGKLAAPNAKRVMLMLSAEMLLVIFYSDFIRTIPPILVVVYILFQLRYKPAEEKISMPAPSSGLSGLGAVSCS